MTALRPHYGRSCNQEPFPKTAVPGALAAASLKGRVWDFAAIPASQLNVGLRQKPTCWVSVARYGQTRSKRSADGQPAGHKLG